MDPTVLRGADVVVTGVGNGISSAAVGQLRPRRAARASLRFGGDGDP
jgi:hypothetical protein